MTKEKQLIIFSIIIILLSNVIIAIDLKIFFLLIFSIVVLFMIIFKKNKVFYAFIFLLPLMPKYFAIDFSGLPLMTIYRLTVLFVFLIEFSIYGFNIFKKIIYILKKSIGKIVLFMLLVFLVSALNAKSNEAFITIVGYIFDNILLFVIVFNRINSNKSNYQDEIYKILKLLVYSTLMLSIFGILEFLTGKNVFSMLDTVKRDFISTSDTYIRMGAARVETSFGHPLGYGLFLILIIPVIVFFIRIAKSRAEINFYSLIFFLAVINIFLTASRSTMLCLLIEILFLFAIINFKMKIKLVYISMIFILILVLITFNMNIGTIGILETVKNSILMMSDAFLKTNYIDNFGSNSDPFIYRKFLVHYAWQQPTQIKLIGKGLSFLRNEPLRFWNNDLNPYHIIETRSIDNFYILKFLETGVFGVLSIISMFMYYILKVIKIIKSRVADIFSKYVCTGILISMIVYYIYLFMVDELDTLKYMWVFYAIVISIDLNNSQNKTKSTSD